MVLILQDRFGFAAGLQTALLLLNGIPPQKSEPLWPLTLQFK